MKKNVLLRTNLFICTIIILGFILTSYISYHSNNGILEQDVEHITSLTSEGIYHKIDSLFTKPINISLTMANDSLLKSFLEEEEHNSNSVYIQTMREYLSSYRKKYDYDSVFLVSAKTNRYYHFEDGIDRTLTKDNPENQWYYSFLEDSSEYNIVIDNDEVQSANNEITIFINCKIFSPDGDIMGVVGVGFAVDTIQQIFQNYENEFSVKAYLADSEGLIEISTTKTGYERTSLFESSHYGSLKDSLLVDKDNSHSMWYESEGKNGYIVSQYVPNLGWYLIIDNDTSLLKARLQNQFLMGILIIILVTGLVLFVITNIIRKYNSQIVMLTVEKEKARRTAFQTETEKMYENIYEVDITHNRPASEETEHYFESLGVPPEMPFDESLKVIAQKQIKEEYRDGYINTFSTANVLKAYEEGQESLNYDFMITGDDHNTYYWMRITVRIFFWKEDQSVRMLVYRQNIDNEKQKEKMLIEKMQKDSLCGLYNKAASQAFIRQILEQQKESMYAFFILDIDNFKTVNDTCGHATGDMVIADFAGKIKSQFHPDDIVGRIGGDEFVAFLPIPSKEWVESKVKTLVSVLRYDFSDGFKTCRISSSIGVAIAPQAGSDFETLYKSADKALYKTKENGKNGYTITYGNE